MDTPLGNWFLGVKVGSREIFDDSDEVLLVLQI